MLLQLKCKEPISIQHIASVQWYTVAISLAISVAVDARQAWLGTPKPERYHACDLIVAPFLGHQRASGVSLVCRQCRVRDFFWLLSSYQSLKVSGTRFLLPSAPTARCRSWNFYLGHPAVEPDKLWFCLPFHFVSGNASGIVKLAWRSGSCYDFCA